MFLQTPDTSAYMIGGYAFAFAAMAVYLVSLVIRFRNLNRDLTMLEDLDQEASQKK
ncbi:MAG: hypothetical protein AB1649_11675 [Chloroflexota bacterium]